ncbi:MAG: cupin domain-containing protein [Saprospiraceae bacterium]|nr:cupin domain-containing protein [Saprospiraceae bacterium]
MGEILYNAVTNDRMEFIQTAESSNGKITEFYLTLAPKASWAKNPRHFHSHQTETFKVLSGELNLTAGDHHYILKPGDEKIVVNKFTLHSFWNATDEEVVFQAEIYPPRNIEKGLRMMYALASQGKVNTSNIPKNPFHILIMMDYIDSYFAYVPWKLQRFLLKIGSKLARSLGYS